MTACSLVCTTESRDMKNSSDFSIRIGAGGPVPVTSLAEASMPLIVWGPPEAKPETGTWVQAIYFFRSRDETLGK